MTNLPASSTTTTATRTGVQVQVHPYSDDSNETTALLLPQQTTRHVVLVEANTTDDSNESSSKNKSNTKSSSLLNSGTLRVALGAALFAATNAAATALYRRKGSTVVSLYILRSPIIYAANALIVVVGNYYHRTRTTTTTHNNNNDSNRSHSIQTSPPMMSATNVLLLQTGCQQASQLALIRSFLNAIKAVLLSIGFVFLTYADAFVVFKGVAVCGTLVVARTLVGVKEKLAPHELLCGLGVVVGILMIHPPQRFLPTDVEDTTTTTDTIEATDTATTSLVGMMVVVVSGLMSSVSGTLVRMLSETGGPHDGRAPPAMLLSYLMVVMFLINGSVAVVFRYVLIDVVPQSAALSSSSPSSPSPWAWTVFLWPRDATDYLLIVTNCVCTLGGHLATASGYATTRAGIVAFLQLTEIPWVYLLDVLVLHEATTTWKSMGSAIVFVSAVAVAVLRQQQPQQPKQ